MNNDDTNNMDDGYHNQNECISSYILYIYKDKHYIHLKRGSL